MKSAIVLREITKVYRTHSLHREGLKSIVLNPFSVWQGEKGEGFVAINHVSFEVHQGETFGVIGRNGAGKSTLLGLMSAVLRPTWGTLAIQGRLSPLLELGVGFTPELTGRENILINGVLLGMRKREVERHLQDIIAFSGLGSFIDQPLKTYSSGMQVRLGFSIAIHGHPDVLLVDEVLAVGDAEFQEKCLVRIGELKKQGATIVFVSHDLVTIEAICDRALWLDHGHLLAIGSPGEVIRQYQSQMHHPSDSAERKTELLQVIAGHGKT